MRIKIFQSVLLSLTLIIFTACEQKQADETIVEDITFTSESEEALEAFNKGLALFDIGDANKSREYFSRAIETDPNFASAYVYRSYVGGSAGEFSDYMKQAVTLKEYATNDGEKIMIEIGESYLVNGAEKRLELCNKLVQLYPNSARANIFLAQEYDARDNPEEARKIYVKAIGLAPKWDAAHSSLAFSYLNEEPKDFLAAKEHFGHALDIAPDVAFHHINVGDAHRALDDLENSKNSYAKALEIDPNNETALLKRGHVNSFLGNVEEARTDYQAARQANPDFAGFYLQYEAFSYLLDEGADASLSWLEAEAASINDMDVDDSRKNQMKLACTNVCAWIALHHGKTDHIEELITNRNQMSLTNAELIGTEDAESNFKAQNAFWEGLLAAMKGEYEIAAMKAEENKELLAGNDSPTSLYNYHFLLGWSDLQQENFESAVEHFEQGSPNWIYNKYHLAKAYQGAGNMEKANEIFKEIAVYNFNNVGYALVRNEAREKVASL